MTPDTTATECKLYIIYNRSRIHPRNLSDQRVFNKILIKVKIRHGPLSISLIQIKINC